MTLLVHLALPSSPFRTALEAELAQHAEAVRVEVVREVAPPEPGELRVVHAPSHAAALPGLLEAAAALGPSCVGRVLVVFDTADDPARAAVAAAGGAESVLGPGAPVGPLCAAIVRAAERRERQRDLRSSTAQTLAMLEKGNDGMYVLRGDDIIWANRRFCDMVGFELEALTASDFSLERIIAAESQSTVAAHGQKRAAGQAENEAYEFIARRKNNTTFSAHVSVSRIVFDGEPAVLGILQDVSRRKRHERMLKRHNQQLAALAHLSTNVNQAMDLGDTLQVGCDAVIRYLGVDAAGVHLLSRDGRHLVLAKSAGIDPALEQALERIPLGETTALGRAVRAGEILVLTDLAKDAHIESAAQAQFKSAIAVPMRTGRGTLGVGFALSSTRIEATKDIKSFLRTVGDLLGAAIDKARMYDDMRQAVRRMTALDECACAVASTLDVHEVAHTVANSVVRLVGAHRVVIYQHDPGLARFVPLYGLDGDQPIRDSQTVARRDTLMGLALELQRPVQRVQNALDAGAPEFGAPRHEAALFGSGYGSVVAVPIIADRAPIGALLLAHRADDPFDDGALDALAALANHVALALKNAALLNQREQALDELTATQQELVQVEKLRALGELSAGVAHDFNNMLGAIMGRAQLLRRGMDDLGLLCHLDVIEQAASDGAETVRRIQEFGRQTPDTADEEVDLNDVVRDVVELTRSRWDQPERAIAVSVSLSDADTRTAGRPHELREVLVNLVNNAVDAMPDGGTLEVRTQPGAAGEVCIDVQDSGTGMPEDVQKRIFDPFFTTKGKKGTGLGLSVSYGIIKRHGGELSVRSEMGEDHGTTFRIALPPWVRPGLPVARPPSGRPRVLVIDDEDNVREVLVDVLEGEDCDVVEAATGEAGLALFKDAPFDLVFTDLGLPDLSGFDVATKLKAQDPTVPICLVSGWSSTLEPGQAASRGIDAVLNKPFLLDDVLGALERLLGLARA